MQPEELIFALALTVFLPLMVIRMSLAYKAKKQQLARERSQADNSLTTSELMELIEEAVARAVLPLNRRVGDLEDQLEQLRDEDRALLADEWSDSGEGDALKAPKTVGRVRPR